MIQLQAEKGIHNGRVYGYVDTPSKKKKANEAGAFHLLGSFIQLVIELAGEYEKKEPLIGHSAKQTPLSSETVNTSRPDSYLYLLLKSVMGDKTGWEQLLAVGDFKKKKIKDIRENRAQVLWGMHHIMRNDPRRCKTYGYSMEDDQARLWCYSRASVVVTEKFNWIENPEHFVKFILAFALTDAKHFPPPRNQQLTTPSNTTSYDSVSSVNDGFSSPLSSPPSSPRDESGATCNEGPWLSDEHQMRVGLDPTMRRVSIGEKIQYEIYVGEDCYVTEGVICDWKADCGTGRATRVWIVHLKNKHDEKFVLKDVWLEEGSTREGDTLDAIRKRVNELKHGKEPPPKLEEWFNNHLLHKHSDQTIGEPVPGVHNSKKYIRLEANGAASQSIMASIHRGSQRTHSVGRPIGGNPKRPPVKTHNMPSRFHYRITFEGGAMEQLDHVSDLKSASQAVIGILRGCWVLWKCGYIHRDISSSNALWDPKTKTGRLADFDYTAVFDKERKGTVRTGTPHFWSIEVEQGTFFRLPDIFQALGKRSERPRPPEAPRPPFQHNVLHDLESIYWLSLWTMLWLVCDEDLVGGEVNPVRVQLYDAVFLPTGDARQNFMRQGHIRGAIFHNHLNAFHNVTTSKLVSDLHFKLMPSGLEQLFAKAQADLTTDESTVSPDSPVFSEAFEWIEDMLNEIDQDIAPFGGSTVTPLRTFPLVLKLEGGPDEVRRPRFFLPFTQSDADDSTVQSSSKRQKTSISR
ncbi:hypothetical protein L218DRAFT_964846 [Marasmius fiardii PR-910]|nr:hypothetical protein L218DRAFT_964846 [Marasmius fiardii PR-910]